ncbi:MAG: ion transporter [Firmicutes bacterium]|nr:ion transporter [Bacillota bacterium]
MRRRIYEIIEHSNKNDKASNYYDAFMILVIIISLVPLNFKEDSTALIIIDKVCAGIFIIDYILRWITADQADGKKAPQAFLLYPFTIMAIIDLVSILPSISLLSQGFKTLRVVRMIRALRVARVFKSFRYSKNIQIIINVMKKAKTSLIVVGVLAIGYVYLSAIIIFNVEPETFDTILDAIYWAMVSLTTVGYGDIYPVSLIGRAIAMSSTFLGIAIVALPAGIITAGYMKEIEKADDNNNI